MMKEGHNMFSILSSAIGEFLNLKTDIFKDRIISILSAGFSRVLSLLIILMMLMIVFAVFAFGFIALIGDALGSWSIAAFIVGGACMIALVILYLFRKRLFQKMFTNILTDMTGTGSSEPDEWKTLSLALIRYLRTRIGG